VKIKKFLLLAFATKLLFVAVICIVLYADRLFSNNILFSQTATEDTMKLRIETDKPNLNVYNREGFTPLMIWVALGDYPKVKLLIDHKADVTLAARNEDGNSALALAIIQGNYQNAYKIIQLLIDGGASVVKKNKHGRMPIHHLVEIQSEKTRLRVLELLIKHGADINARGGQDGNTMLHFTVERNDGTWAQLLLDTFGSKIDLDLKNNNEITPQELAHSLGFRDLEALIKAWKKLNR